MTVELLTRKEVAAKLRVDVTTVTRWAKIGKLDYALTPGGHRRYFAAQVGAILRGTPLSQAQVRALRLQAEGGEQS